MRNILNSLLLATALVALGTGCASTREGGDGPQVKDFAPAVKTIAYVGTTLALKQHPEWRPGFELAARELAALAEAETVDFVVLLSIVNRLPVDELQGEEATIFITAGSILLAEYGQGLLPLDKVEKARPIAAALRDGLALALR